MDYVGIFRRIVRSDGAPAGFWKQARWLPFALPVFGGRQPAALRRIDRALRDRGVHAGVYHVDVRRDMRRPDYQPCVLLPCHRGIPIDPFEEMCRCVDRITDC